MTDKHISNMKTFDTLCDEFEAELNLGRNPKIEEFLNRAPADIRDLLFCEILFLELADRETLPGKLPSNYLKRFSGQSELVRQVWLDIEFAQKKQSTAPFSVGDIQVGQDIDRYTILARLGEGGMGAVFKARDNKLDRLVALKFPNFGLANTELVSRFYSEARAVATLRHPNICPVYDVDEFQGHPYISMALVHGQTLGELVKARTKLDESEVLKLVEKIAVTLQYAHDHGIVHRDLKPANIMIDVDGDPIIMDFGLARRENDVRYSGSNQREIVGTPAYMPPEQIRAENYHVGPASDIYSLGVIAFQLATGQLPFEGTTSQLFSKAIEQTPDLARDRARNLTQEFSAICDRMIAKAIEDRFPTMNEVALAMGELRSDESGSFSSVNSALPQRINSLAILPFVNETGDEALEYFCDGLTDSLIDLMSELAHIKVKARSSVNHFQEGTAQPEDISKKLKTRTVLFGKVQERAGSLLIKVELVDTVDGSRIWGKKFQRSKNELIDLEEDLAGIISKKLKLQMDSDPESKRRSRPTGNPIAFQHYLKGRFHWNKRNENDLNKAISHFEKAIEADANFAQAWSGLADSYGLRIAWGESKPHDLCPLAKQMANQALELDESLADAHVSLGYISVVYDWDWNAAEQYYRRAIALNRSYANAHHWYGYLLMIWQRFDEARHAFNESQELDPLSLIVSANQGFCSFFQGRYQDALQILENTLALDASLPSTHYYLGLVHEQLGNLDQAIKELQQSVAISNGVPGDLGALAHAYAQSGQIECAMQTLDKLIEMEKRGGITSANQALVRLALGDFDGCFEQLDRAIEERDFYLIYLHVDRRLDPIRDDRRFMELPKLVGLPN